MTDETRREPPPGRKRLYWCVDPDMSDEEIAVWAEHFVDAVLGDRVIREDGSA